MNQEQENILKILDEQLKKQKEEDKELQARFEAYSSWLSALKLLLDLCPEPTPVDGVLDCMLVFILKNDPESAIKVFKMARELVQKHF